MQKNTKKNLNFFGLGVFGSEPVINSWCSELLKYDQYSISYFGVQENKKVPTLTDISCKHSDFERNPFLRRVKFVLMVKKYIDLGKIIPSATNSIVYFPGCSILKFFLKNLILYVPTLSVSQSAFYRIFFDTILKVEARIFDNIITVNHYLEKKIGHPKSFVVELGSRAFDYEPKTTDTIDFLYVGTLFNRNILDSVKAFQIACKKNKKICYTIIGNGCDNEAKKIIKYIDENSLDSSIKFLDGIYPPEVDSYFKSANFGISYVPQSDYFDLQPVTKVYEYCAAGLFVLATNTTAQRNMLIDDIGICVDCDIDLFADKISYLANKADEFDYLSIHRYGANFLNKTIVRNKLLPVLDSK